MKKICTVLAIFIALSASAQQPAETPAGTLRVLVKPAKPFAFEEEGQLKGYSVELWRRVAQEAGLHYEMRVVKSVPEVLDALQRKEADVGVGALSITAEREKVLDFSHPFYESGLQILARASDQGSVFGAFKPLFNTGVLQVVGLLLLALLIVSNILWLVEKKRNAESFPQNYRQGLGGGDLVVRVDDYQWRL